GFARNRERAAGRLEEKDPGIPASAPRRRLVVEHAVRPPFRRRDVRLRRRLRLRRRILPRRLTFGLFVAFARFLVAALFLLLVPVPVVLGLLLRLVELADRGGGCAQQPLLLARIDVAGRRQIVGLLPGADHLARARPEHAVAAAGVEAQRRERD